MENRNRMYSGQAIAIVMVIVVVAAVLGASLYSRTLKNNEDVINKQDSDVSLEQAGNILDFIISEVSFSKLSEMSVAEEASYDNVEDFLEAAAVNPTDRAALNNMDNWCEDTSDGEGSASYLTITPSRTDLDEEIEVSVGNNRSFNFESINVVGACSLPVIVEPVDASGAIFTIKKIFIEPDGDVKDYSENDMEVYCVSDSGSTCPSSINPSSSVNMVRTNDPINVSLAPSGTYRIYEVKVIPLKGDITVSYGDANPSGCFPSDMFSHVKLNVAVNCYGSYREKQIIFPSVESLGYSNIFDYSIYNNGNLRPS